MVSFLTKSFLSLEKLQNKRSKAYWIIRIVKWSYNLILPLLVTVIIFYFCFCSLTCYILQGGDGFFNEVLNGLLSTRYKASYPPVPADFLQSLGENKNIFLSSTDEPATDTSDQNEDQFPLIPDSDIGCSGVNTCFFLFKKST